MKNLKKAISVLLSASILISSGAASFAEAEKETVAESERVRVVATGDAPITINASEAEVTEQGIFTNSTYTLYVDRDYEQYKTITVHNEGYNTTEFYLECGNYSSDLAINFIKGGAKDEPIILKPGEKKEVTLAIFAQNAIKDTYEFEIYAYQTVNGESKQTSSATVRLNVNLHKLNLQITKISEDDNTLAQTYRIKNESYYPITDLNVSVDDSLSKYAYLKDSIEHTELTAGRDIEFTIIPILRNMIDSKQEMVKGNVIISGLGDAVEEEIIFDTTGKEIISTNMEDLAFEQDGNPYINMQVDAETANITTKKVDDTTTELDASFVTTYGQNSEKSYRTEQHTIIKTISASEAATVDETSGYTISGKTITITDTTLLDTKANAKVNEVSLFASQDEQITMINNIITVTLDYADEKEIHEFLEQYNNYNLSRSSTDGNEQISYFSIINDSLYEKEFTEDERNKFDSLVHLSTIFHLLFEVKDNKVSDREVYEYDNNGKKSYFSSDLLIALMNAFDNDEKSLYDYIRKVWEKTSTRMETMSTQLKAKHKKEEEKYNKGNEIHRSDKTSSECTNVGQVTSHVKAPGYTTQTQGVKLQSVDSPVKVYYTGRFHGGGYVNYEPINYTYSLNGEVIATGSNSGLTELDIMELPADKFKFGEDNVFVRKYDTNPGTHYVTKENEFTFIYPSDTIIDYVGDTETLPDVRLKADYACYDENIFVDGDTIIGSKTKIKVNYYNRGSQSGWYTMNLYVNDNLIQSKEGFMEYFSINHDEFDWTPTQEDNEIKVEIINTSRRIVERSTDNNIAVSQVSAREREIPSIKSVEPSGEIEQATDTIISATIDNNADIKSVSFSVDGKNIDGETKSSGSNYWITTNMQSIGEHKISVKVTDYADREYTMDGSFTVIEAPERYVGYEFGYNSSEIYSTKDADVDLRDYVYILVPVEGKDNTYTRKELTDFNDNISIDYGDDNGIVTDANDKFSFKTTQLGETQITLTLGVNTQTLWIRTFETSPKMATYNVQFGEKSYPYVTVYQKSEDNTWNWCYDYNELYSDDRTTITLVFSPDDFTKADDYIVVIRDYNGNAAVVPFTEGETIVNTKDNAKLTFTTNSKVKCESIRATLSLEGENKGTIYSSSQIDSSISLPKQKYQLNIGFTYDDEYYNVTTNVDLTSGDEEIDLVSLLNIVELEFDFDTVSDTPDIMVADEYGWQYVNIIKVDNKHYNIVIDDEYMLEHPSEYNVYVVDGNNMYSAPLTADKVKITGVETNTLTFKSDDKVEIKSLRIKTIGNVSSDIPLAVDMDKPINLPKSNYTIGVQYIYDNVNLYAEYNADLTIDSKEIDLSAEALKTNFVAKWSDVYADTALISLWNEGRQLDSYSEYANNTGRNLDNGNYDWEMLLSKGALRYRTSGEFVIDENTAATVDVDSQFEGKLTAYQDRNSYVGNSNYQFRVSELKDKNGNSLMYCDSYGSNLKGKIIFTNTTNPEEIYEQEVEYSDLYASEYSSYRSYSVTLPNVTGTYNVQLILDGYGINAPVASVESGEYTKSISVALTCDTKDADIYYTLDGTKPTVNSKKYTKAFTISSSCTLRAIAVYGGDESEVVSYDYTIKKSSSGGGGGGVSRYTVTVSYVDQSGNNVGSLKLTERYGAVITGSDLKLPDGYELAETVNHKVLKNETISVKVNALSSEQTDINKPETISEKAFINGYENGTFNPDNNITRAEVSMLIYNLISDDSDINESVLNRFNDIPDNHWGRKAMSYNVANGYMSGDAEGNTFRPDASMTRAELAQLLTNLNIKSTGTNTVTLSDIENHWAKPAITTMAQCGVISGYEDGTFRPDNTVTRAEAVTMISRLFDRSSDWVGNTSFDDVTPDMWSYKTIMNAVNGK